MFEVIVDSLYKRYGHQTAVNNVSFSVNKNEIFGLIGPDGAGKTTILRIITTLLLPDSGRVEVLGLDAVIHYRELRKKLGYMPGRFSLYPDLTVEENLSFFASIFSASIKKNYYLIQDIYSQLEPFKDRKSGKLSGGMKQKLALCCALIHKPELLVLDEPTTGVDAVSRKEFWDMLTKLKQQGISILVSTPYMDEAKLCDRVCLIQNGSVLDIASPKEIVSGFPGELYGITSEKKWELMLALRNYKHTKSVFPFGDMFHYRDNRDTFDCNEVNEYLHSRGIEDAKIEKITPGIEDSFMEKMLKQN